MPYEITPHYWIFQCSGGHFVQSAFQVIHDRLYLVTWYQLCYLQANLLQILIFYMSLLRRQSRSLSALPGHANAVVNCELHNLSNCCKGLAFCQSYIINVSFYLTNYVDKRDLTSGRTKFMPFERHQSNTNT